METTPEATAERTVTMTELQLATRNHGMPLEMLREPITPVGLHYLLTHYDIPGVDPAEWHLDVDGLVTSPVSLSLDDLRALPAVTRAVTMECAGNGRALLDPRAASQPWLLEAVGTGEWTGVTLDALLDEAGVSDDAVELLFTGADRGIEGGVEQDYQRSLPVAEAIHGGAMIAYELNGAPLPPQHGFPARLVMPGWYGMTNVKWLTSITAIDTPFDGYQQATGYVLRTDDDDPGTPVKRMLPRSLMIPPGIPDFFTRRRTVDAGACTISGRAWSGRAAITEVEVSSDDGATWTPAAVEPPTELAAWQGWSADVDLEPGEYVVMCRAADADGNVQPLEPQWNVGGYCNNAVHRVDVSVRTP